MCKCFDNVELGLEIYRQVNKMKKGKELTVGQAEGHKNIETQGL